MKYIKGEETFMDNIDEDEVSRDVWTSINGLYAKISHLVNFKYNLLIYRAIRGKYISQKNIARITGLSRQRISKIVNQFERREVERQNEG